MIKTFLMLMVLVFYNLHGAVDTLSVSSMSTIELSWLSIAQPLDEIEQKFNGLRQQYYVCCGSKVGFNIAAMLVSSELRNLLDQHQDDLEEKPVLRCQIQQLYQAVQGYLKNHLLINREDT